MASKLKLNSNAGGSISIQAPDGLTTDEVVTAQEPIGIGQTWQDVTDQRAKDTTYTNDTGRPIYVKVRSSSSATAARTDISLSVDGIKIDRFSANTYQGSTVTYGAVDAIIPAGSTYSVTIVAGILVLWAELR